MKILVTGGAGFIGSHLTDFLVSKKHQVLVLDNLSHGRLSNIATKSQKYKFKKIDIRSPRLSTVFRAFRPEKVFHLAAQINVRESLKNPARDAESNIIGALNVFQNAQNVGAKQIVFTSTGGALYGEAKIRPTPENHPTIPLSPYGIAKLATENYLKFFHQVYKLPSVILRFSNVYGPRQNPQGEAGVVAIFADRLLKGLTPIINGSGNQTRDFVYVGDVVQALNKASSHKKFDVFNIATEQEVSINEIFNILKKITKFSGAPKYVPAILGEIYHSVLSAKHAKQTLSWQPRVGIEEGLRKIVEYMLSLEH
ncbi:MAG: GDP-mannose 4,6-dehydratase [Patescibacteria group bacterium]